MNCEIACARIEQDGAVDTAVDGVDRGPRFNGDAGWRLYIGKRRFGGQAIGLEWRRFACGHGVRDAIVRCADDAADRRRTVAQRRRSADHFDLVGRDWVDRDEMVFAQIGSAVSIDAVFGDADTIDVETANDRPA